MAGSPVTRNIIFVPDVVSVNVGDPAKSSCTVPCTVPIILRVPPSLTNVAVITPPIQLAAVWRPPTTKASIVYMLSVSVAKVISVAGDELDVVTAPPKGK